MAKNELSPSKKGRVTKLSNKSVNELVNIILRKDDVERKQASRISDLQDSVSSKVAKYCMLDEKYQKSLKTNQDLREKYSELVSANNSYADEDDRLKNDNTSLHNICVGLGVVCAILLITVICLL